MKTQITDWLFLYNTIQKVIDKKLDIKLKVFYFTLEMSKEQKMLSAFSNILYVKEGIRIAPKDLRSTKADDILSQETLDIILKYEPYFQKIEEIVEFIDDVRHPTGIYYFMQKYAELNGTQHKKIVEFTNNETKEKYKQEIDDWYEADDPDEYVMCIIDHVSLITQEKEEGRTLSLHQSIVKLSSNYMVKLRNKYNYIPVIIQQQASAQESIENLKANKLKPTLNGLGDCKLTQRDADVILGLFSPFRHEIASYLGYDVTQFMDNIRFMEVLGGREGGGGTVCPLYFDGAVNFFKELPLPKEELAIKKIHQFLHDKLRQ